MKKIPPQVLSLFSIAIVLGHASVFSQSPHDLFSAADLVEKADSLKKVTRYDSSILLYERALSILKEKGDWEKVVLCYNGIADNLVKQSKFQEGLSSLREAQGIAERNLGDNNLELARTYNLLGYLLAYEGQFDEAFRKILRGRAIREEKLGKNTPLVAASLHTLGTAYILKRNYDEALHCLREALIIQLPLLTESHYDVASSYSSIGFAYDGKSDHDSAIYFYMKALSVLEDIHEGSSPLAASCHYYAAVANMNRGNIFEAGECVGRALSIFSKLFDKDNLAVAASYRISGQISEAEGDYDRAVELYDRVLRITERLNGENHPSIVTICKKLGNVYSKKKEYRKAEQFFNRSLEIQKAVFKEDNPDIGFTYLEIADMYQREGDYASALNYYTAALQIRSAIPNSEKRNDLPAIFNGMGSTLISMKKYDSAAVVLGEALKIQNAMSRKNPIQLSATLKGLGDLCTERNDFRNGILHYNKSMATLRNDSLNSTFFQRELLELTIARGQTFEKLYASSRNITDLRASLDDYAASINVIERIRKTYSAEGSKILLEEDNHGVYQNAVRISATLFSATRNNRYRELSFAFAERSKAGIFQDALQEAHARHFAGMPDSLLQEERRLSREITACETMLEKELQKSEHDRYIAILREKHFLLAARYQQLVARFEQEFPDYFELKYRNDGISVAALQQKLGDDACFISYFLGENEVFVFVITRTSFDMVSTPKVSEVFTHAKNFYSSLKTIDPAEFVYHGTSLYDLLLKPVERKIAGRRLLIIAPDGILHYLPFETLLTTHVKAAHNPDFTALNYLIKKFEISYSYSAQLFLLSRSSGKVSEASFAGFAPVFSDSNKNTSAIASTYFREQGVNARTISVDGRKFNELPYSEDEVVTIARAFEENGKHSFSYVYGSATEENFKTDAEKYSYLHVATHGYLAGENPDLCAIMFSQPGDSPHLEDGFLYAGETYGLHLNAELVVLSSCESGAGKLVKGEGVMAMTRGFLYSGARNIIYSLWKVYDKHASELMVAFYGNVLRGGKLTSALRNAKLRMIRNPSTAFPNKWGGFVLVRGE